MEPEPVGLERHQIAWIVAGVFGFLGVCISIFSIVIHLRHYNVPRIQRNIVRILLMVPIYTVDSFISLVLKDYALYVDLARDCYEAYVIYLFFKVLIELMGGENELRGKLEEKPLKKHPIPLCCITFKPGSVFLHRCKQMILQYVIIRPALAIATFVLELTHFYAEGSFMPNRGYLWITLIDNFSISLALYYLVLFYEATKDDLQGHRPIAKFLVVKAIIFFSFWQGVLIAILAHFNVITATQYWTVDNISRGLQDFLICIEMFLIAVAFQYAFGHRAAEKISIRDRIREIPSQVVPMVKNFVHVATVEDVLVDTYESFARAPKRHVVVANYSNLPKEEQLKHVKEQGWLEKQGDDLIGHWKKRYVILIESPSGVLYYEKNPFEEAEFSIPLGYVDLHDVTEVRAHLKDEDSFELVTQKRLWVFKCENAQQRKSWLSAIKSRHEALASEVEVINEYDQNSSRKTSKNVDDV